MKKYLLSVLLMLVMLFISYQSITYSTGPPESHTNAPGEGSCADPSCHGGSVITTGSAWDNITLDPAGTTLSTLKADSTYTFSLSFSDPASVRYGFELCVLPSGATANSGSVGTLINTSSETQLVGSGSRSYIEHSASGTSAPTNTKTWSFDWQVPSDYTGGAVFYVVINSSNNDNSNDGDGSDIIYAKTFAANISLPVTWLSVNAQRDHSNIILKWATASELNADRFEVERSVDGKEWTAIGSVKAAGNSTTERSYKYADLQIANEVYYRLKQFDYNGAFTFSNIVKVSRNDNGNELLLFNRETHELYKEDEPIGSVELYSQMGVKVWSTNVNGSKVILPELPRGIYFLRDEHLTQKILF